MSSGIIYLLKRRDNPGIVRIDALDSNDPGDFCQKLNQLNRGKAVPYKCVHNVYVKDAKRIKRELNKEFRKERVNYTNNFKMSPAKVQRVRAKMNDYDNDTQSLNFYAMGIKKGAKLQFSGGPERVTVYSSNEVVFKKEKPKSLTRVTRRLLTEHGEGSERVLPTQWWSYRGKRLVEYYHMTKTSKCCKKYEKSKP